MEDQIYITIAKVLHGEASAAERTELDAWLQADRANAELFEEMRQNWADAEALFDEPQFDAAPAWEKVSGRIHAGAAVEAPKRSRTIAFPAWVRYSSAVAAVLIIAFLIWSPFRSGGIEVVADNGNKVIELPDHSVVTLRQGSTLRYEKAFEGKERSVTLEGEAFFEVARNERQPFVIDAQAVSVTVLGTSFNVSCTEFAADVSVATGRVRVSAQKNLKKTVILLPGNTARYEEGKFIEHPTHGDEMYWMTGKLSFNSEPLANAVSVIASAKEADIAIDASLPQAKQQQMVTASFNDQSLEDMLTELCLITNTRWEKNGAAYVIRDK